MKKMENYSAFWQKKRNQLRVDGDPKSDWLQMRSVLDNHLPSSGLIRKPYNPGGLKWIYKLFIGFSAAVSLYGLAHLYFSKKQPDQSRSISVKDSAVQPSPLNLNSAPLHSVLNSSSKQPRVNAFKDSLLKFNTKRVLPYASTQDTSDITITGELKKRPESIDNTGQRRDSVSLINVTSPKLAIDSVAYINKPLKSTDLKSRITQKAASDSLKQLKKKKRTKIAVFF